jgi:small subunit ribosomal protein S6
LAPRPYEVMVIVDSTLDDEVVQSVLKRTSTMITTKFNGTLGRTEKWGRRKLAYEIEKKTDGYYTLIEFTAEPTEIKELDRQLFLADEILRHKIILVPAAGAGRSLDQPPPLDEIASGGGRDRD